MAQDIDLLGAVYPDVPAVELPKDGGGTALFTDVTATTAAAADVAQGKQFYTAAGVLTQGTASGGGAVTVTDTTAADGSTIREITAVDISSDTVTSGAMLSGYTAHDSSGAAITGSITSRAAQTITPTASDQTIPSGVYLSGAQTVEGIVTANLTAANIVNGVTVKVGTATDDDSVLSVTGTASGGGGVAEYTSALAAPSSNTFTVTTPKKPIAVIGSPNAYSPALTIGIQPCTGFAWSEWLEQTNGAGSVFTAYYDGRGYRAGCSYECSVAYSGGQTTVTIASGYTFAASYKITCICEE